METNKIKKMDEAIDLLDETIKEVGSIKEKTTELRELINNASDLNLKFEEGIKTINLVTEETTAINKKLESIDREIEDINKSINCVNDSIKNSNKEIDDLNKLCTVNKNNINDIQKVTVSIKKMLKCIVGCLIIVLILSIINLII